MRSRRRGHGTCNFRLAPDLIATINHGGRPGLRSMGKAMREDDLRASDNIEDRRGSGFAVRGGGLGIGAVVVLSLLGWALGINPAALIEGAQMVAGGDTPSVSQSNAGRASAPTDPNGKLCRQGAWRNGGRLVRTDG